MPVFGATPGVICNLDGALCARDGAVVVGAGLVAVALDAKAAVVAIPKHPVRTLGRRATLTGSL